MIGSFAAYLLLVSLLTSSGAWATEQSFIARRWPRRFLWLATLCASVLLPLGMALSAAPTRVVIRAQPPAQQVVLPVSATAQVPAPGPAPTQVRPAAPSAAQVLPRSPAAMRLSGHRSFDLIVSIVWLSSSFITALWCLFAGLRLARLVRCAPCATVEGVSVRVTPAGPAVFGVLCPEILWPSWLDEAPAATRSAAIAHEAQHIAARDPLVLATGLLLVVLAPWNPALWWQLRRMRFAMEADCDLRVVRGGTESQAYARALLQIAQARAAWGTSLAMLMSAPSWLERRVRILVHVPARRRVLRGALEIPLALAACVAAAQLPAPSLKSAELRKLPPEDIRPGAGWARTIARARYPELFDKHFDGTAVVAAIFNSDGSLRLVDEHLFAPDVPPTDLDLRIENQRAGIDPINDVGYACHEHGRHFAHSPLAGPPYCTIGPWLDTVNAGRVFVVYEVLAWEPDASRSAARAEAALRAFAPEVFIPSHTMASQVALLMNDDGTVARLSKLDMEMGKSYPVQYPLERFAAMGVPREGIGRSGLFETGTAGVIYAWPRRQDDPPNVGGPATIDPLHPDPNPLPDPREDREDDERIAERYLKNQPPDEVRAALLGAPGTAGVPRMPWILFGRDGRFWDSGFGTALPEEIEDRYPGIRVDRAGIGLINGVSVATAWISPDSPIQQKSDVDLQRRKQFLMTGQGMWPEVSMAGLPPIRRWLVAAVNPGAPAEMGLGGFLSENGSGVEVTVTQADQERLTMNARAQSKYGAHAGSWTQMVRVEAPYRRATTVELPGDTPDQTVRLVLWVERLKP